MRPRKNAYTGIRIEVSPEMKKEFKERTKDIPGGASGAVGVEIYFLSWRIEPLEGVKKPLNRVSLWLEMPSDLVESIDCKRYGFTTRSAMIRAIIQRYLDNVRKSEKEGLTKDMLV
jgi:hypothetical protein